MKQYKSDLFYVEHCRTGLALIRKLLTPRKTFYLLEQQAEDFCKELANLDRETYRHLSENDYREKVDSFIGEYLRRPGVEYAT